MSADRLHAAVNEALPMLADVTAELESPRITSSRAELAEQLRTVARGLLEARNEPMPRARLRPWERQRCRRCGHARWLHSPNADPAEPCTHGWETDEPCECPAFVREGARPRAIA